MRPTTFLGLFVLFGGCSIITDLDDYEVSDGTDGGIDSGGDGTMKQCGTAIVFDTLVDAKIQIRDWPVDDERLNAVSVALIGVPQGREGLEFILSALVVDLQQTSRTFVMNDAILAGQHTALAVIETNGIKGYQGKSSCEEPGAPEGCKPDRAWLPQLCPDGTIRLGPPPDINIDVSEQFSAIGADVGGTFSMRFIGFGGGAHGGNAFELSVVNSSGRALTFYHLGSVPQSDPFNVVFAPVLPPGNGYSAVMYGDGIGTEGNMRFDANQLIDHSWQLRFAVGTLRNLNYEPDPRLTQRIGEPPEFRHDAPFDQVSEDEWPITYE